MLEDPICCAPRVDTFLAVTKIKPLEPEKSEKTEEEKQEIERRLIECLDNFEKIDLDL